MAPSTPMRTTPLERAIPESDDMLVMGEFGRAHS
jgi:hypothetical protein